MIDDLILIVIHYLNGCIIYYLIPYNVIYQGHNMTCINFLSMNCIYLLDVTPVPSKSINNCYGQIYELHINALWLQFQYTGDSTLFEDEDARSFYETLPDLKAFIPGVRECVELYRITHCNCSCVAIVRNQKCTAVNDDLCITVCQRDWQTV